MYWLTWICLDIDECVTKPGICQYNCTNIAGGYYCSCPTGYQLLNGHNCSGSNDNYIIAQTCTHVCTLLTHMHIHTHTHVYLSNYACIIIMIYNL